MALRKLESSILVADQVFEAIHDGIMSGDLPAGHRLRINDLAAELGTSVMPVRESIRRLEETGLVEKVPYRGAVVKGLTREELLRVYDVRRLLEMEAAGLGAAAVSDREVDQMRQEYQAMRQALDDQRVADLLDHDEQLLSILYAASGNPVLLEMTRVLWRRCRPYKIVGARDTLSSGDPSVLWMYQEQLIEAAARHDVAAAAQINLDSLHSATERIRQALPGQHSEI